MCKVRFSGSLVWHLVIEIRGVMVKNRVLFMWEMDQ